MLVNYQHFRITILGNDLDQSIIANVDLTYDNVGQSLHATTNYYLLPYNDWGVMSTPNSVVVLNDNIVVLSSATKYKIARFSKMYGTVEIPVFYILMRRIK